MKEIHFLLLAFFLFVVGCGGDKHEREPAKTPEPVPPKVEPVPEPEPPTNWPSWPFPGFPSLPKWPIPGIPGIPNGPGNPNPSNPVPGTPIAGDVASLGAQVNEARAARGLSAVMILPALNCAADRHAKDIGARKACGHTGQDGSSPWDRAKDCGTSANGEIVACGQGDAKAAVQAWTYSPGHAAIMYDGGQKRMGVAMYQNYWVVIFQK